MRQRLQTALLFAVVVWIWGSTWLAIRLGLQGVPPLTGAALRMLASGVILLIVALGLRARLPRDRIYFAHIAVQGSLLFCLQYALIYWGEQTVPSGLTAVLFATVPILTAIIAAYIFKFEPLSGVNLLGLILGFCGVAVIYWGEVIRAGHASPLGVLAILLAALSGSFAAVFAKRFAHGISPIATVGPGLLVGGLLLALIALVAEHGQGLRFTPVSLGALVYLIIFGSCVAFLAFFTLMKSVRITRLSLITYVIPVIAVGLGVLVAHEQFTRFTFIGAAMVFGGIWLVNVQRRTHHEKTLEPDSLRSSR